MSHNYHIDQPEPKTDIQTALDRLARISRLLPRSERATDKDLGRNVLTRTLDAAFALVRKYLPPIHWLFAAMTATVLFLYVQIVAVTARLVATGSTRWPHVPAPCVLALWHRDAPSLLVAFAKRRPHARTVIMIARDPRGDYLALLCRLIGLGVVRGDSEEGGWEALQQLAHELKDGACVILTADGGGPARIAKIGAVALASSVGVPLIPLAADCHPAIEERHKWDEARNPLPFSSIRVSMGLACSFEPLADSESIEQARKWLEEALNHPQHTVLEEISAKVNAVFRIRGGLFSQIACIQRGTNVANIESEGKTEMIDIQRILYPTDLSSESDEALRYALALARAYDAKLILLYCKLPSSFAEWVKSSRAQQFFKQSLFTRLDTNELKALDWEGVVAEGEDVGLTITEEATKRNADLIVMRSRRRPHAAVLLGSTAETVSRAAPCPVLVTHPSEREWVGLSTGEIELHRLLVAHDFSPDSELALNYGISLAQEYQAEVHLLHVISSEEREEPEVAWSHVGVDSLSMSAARQLKQAVPKEALLWCNLVTAVRCGRAYEEVLGYAREHEIDLICMGASGAGFSLSTLLGSNVDRVLRQAPCPVFVARPVRAAEVHARAASSYESAR
jgi:nucleotide-binding universal stress UspA family protein/lysophospholipid acyltransferase (LPLAT)-like uncharacterized protein